MVGERRSIFGMPIDALPNDLDALRALVSQLTSERDVAIAESRRLTEQNDQLRHLLKQPQRAQFGQRSERLDRDQMQLALEDIETSLANRNAEEEEQQSTETDKAAGQGKKRRINRGALPAHLPRVHVTIEPESTVCPCCHGAMHVIGEESSQRLDKIPAQYRVIVTHRPKYGCRACEGAVVQAPLTRRQLLEELDRPALKPLPTEPYVFAEWRVRRVGIDYHVDVEGHFYSVPYRFARSEVEVRLTGRTVEIFVKGERIAVHMRSSGNGKHTTAADHMPSSHRRYADWTIGRIRRDAALVGPATAALCELILERRPHPEQGFRSCLGILRLVRPFGVARLEAAAARAIEIGALTYGSVRSILDHKLDRHAAYQHAADGVPILHSNIRGSRYYQ